MPPVTTAQLSNAKKQGGNGEGKLKKEKAIKGRIKTIQNKTGDVIRWCENGREYPIGGS